MIKGIIRIGDRTDHGGEVITGSDTMEFGGKKVARVGDLVRCPREGHGVNPIVEGSAHFTDRGRKVAFHGMKAQCGCSLLSSLNHSGIE
jgi:uncharacterized Zn-binding protein involved in type VI secretion